jgi:hypothetical protein
MSTLAKFIMAMIAVLFIALATVVILRSQAPLEQPAISAPMDPTPLDPNLGVQELTPPGLISPPTAVPTNPPPKRRILPGNRQRQGVLGGRFRRSPQAPMQ